MERHTELSYDVPYFGTDIFRCQYIGMFQFRCQFISGIFSLKVCVDCLSVPSLGSSDVLDDFRYIVEQEAVLAEKYGICKPPVDFAALKGIVSKSGKLAHLN